MHFNLLNFIQPIKSLLGTLQVMHWLYPFEQNVSDGLGLGRGHSEELEAIGQFKWYAKNKNNQFKGSEMK